MKKKNDSRKLKLFIVATVLLIFLSGCFFDNQLFQENEENTEKQNLTDGHDGEDTSRINQEEPADFQYNEDGTVILGDGYVAYGFFDKEGTIIDNGNELECMNGKIIGEIQYQQNINSTVEYGLIIMSDYIQQSFAVEDSITKFYRFELTGEDKISIPIELEVTEQMYEVEYLIITEPDATAENFISGEDLNFNNIYASQQTSIGCFPIKGREEPERKEIKDLEFVDWPITLGFDLIEGEYIPFCRAESGQKSTMVIGQDGVDIDYYVVVAFCDWEQVPLNEGEEVGYFNFNEGKNGSYEVTFPDAKDGAMYQMFLFGRPNTGFFGAATFRIELSK